METSFTIPIEKVLRLRRRAEKVREVPLSGPEGWSKSDVDPMRLLAVFPALRLKKGLILRAYQFREGGNGNGIVWVMPEDIPFPEPEECGGPKSLFDPPRPDGALSTIMDFIEGDGSPWSYLCASLFAREITEFGAMWHGCSWSTHLILDCDPFGSTTRFTRRGSLEGPCGNPRDWQWLEPKPKEWRPVVFQDKINVTVTFYTYSGLGQQAIYRHIDTYKAGTYSFQSEEKVLAAGGGGYVL